MKVAFFTLGCKLNFTETSAIAKQFREHGFTKVDFSERSDVYVINTCSVTDNADKECRRVVNKALSVSPDAFVVVTGCYAQLKPESIAEIKGVDLVLGANEKFNITSYLSDLSKRQHALIKACEIESHHTFTDAQSEHERTRVFMKVQDGCDYSCTFCTIPLARGRSRSDSVENVLRRAQTAIENGTKEIVLTGVNLGDFGIEPNTGERFSHFFDLVKSLDALNENVRYRISSIEPNLLSKEIIDFVSQSKYFVPHFHIPLQSGSDKILKLMRRRYLTDLYESRITLIKSKMPHCCIGVDVITGFPGETHQDFLDTYNFINQLPVSYLHVFTYSERDNTPAIAMSGAVPYGERKQRTNMLRILSEKKLRQFYTEQLNTVRPVLFEADNKEGMMHGHTDNYIKVKTRYDEALINQMVPCRMIKIDPACEMEIESIAQYVNA